MLKDCVDHCVQNELVKYRLEPRTSRLSSFAEIQVRTGHDQHCSSGPHLTRDGSVYNQSKTHGNGSNVEEEGDSKVSPGPVLRHTTLEEPTTRRMRQRVDLERRSVVGWHARARCRRVELQEGVCTENRNWSQQSGGVSTLQEWCRLSHPAFRGLTSDSVLCKIREPEVQTPRVLVH